jgi:hypothetical protein
MNARTTRVALRSIAIAIAIAGLIDPAWTVSRPAERNLVVIGMTAAPPSDVEQALRANLPGWNVASRAYAARLPCGRGERCVVIADGSIDSVIPDDLAPPLSLITVPPDGMPNVAVQSVALSSTHRSAAGVAQVALAGTGVEGKRSEIRILDGAAVVGSTSYDWTAAATATIEVPWWPIETGARVLRIEVTPLDGEQTTLDNHIDAGASVAAGRAMVLVFDARPSWSSTFVRRAIEDDARFTVGFRARLAPALSAGTASGRLDPATLDLASSVVIGGPDALTSSDVALLEQFVQVRGGTLVLLAERVASGPLARLVPGSWTEHLAARPEAIGPLHASEILRTDRPPVTATTVARAGSASAILVLPTGNGHVVVSGAMDAWRYRDLDAGAFDRFWRSLMAESAAWGEGIQLTFDRPLAARGSRVRFTIRDRRMTPAGSSEASAVLRCGAGPASTIRLWPAGASGAFSGEVPLAASGSCTIEATVNGRVTSGSIAVADNPAVGVSHTLAKLERSVTASGGVAARAGDEAGLARAIASAGPPAAVAGAVHPLRAAWWMMPFAACLSAEWWLRRRSGLR